MLLCTQFVNLSFLNDINIGLYLKIKKKNNNYNHFFQFYPNYLTKEFLVLLLLKFDVVLISYKFLPFGKV